LWYSSSVEQDEMVILRADETSGFYPQALCRSSQKVIEEFQRVLKSRGY
jgi:hypothetical protein